MVFFLSFDILEGSCTAIALQYIFDVIYLLALDGNVVSVFPLSFIQVILDTILG